MLSQSPKSLKIYIYKSKLLTFRMAAWGALQTCFPVKKKKKKTTSENYFKNSKNNNHLKSLEIFLAAYRIWGNFDSRKYLLSLSKNRGCNTWNVPCSLFHPLQLSRMEAPLPMYLAKKMGRSFPSYSRQGVWRLTDRNRPPEFLILSSPNLHCRG